MTLEEAISRACADVGVEPPRGRIEPHRWVKCDVIGIAMNSRSLTAAQAAKERQRVRAEFGLPVCDVLRDGPDELVEAVLKMRR